MTLRFDPNLSVVVNTSWQINATGESPATDPAALINKYRLPMLVDEIRFSGTPAANDSTWPYVRDLDMKIAFGRVGITNDFVPMNALAPEPAGLGQIRIRLSRPMYIEPGDVPTISVRVAPNRVAQTFIGNLAFVGRLTDWLPPGTKYWMPYFSGWRIIVPSSGEGSTPVTQTLRSNRLMFANPFRVPLEMRRFVGYCDYTRATSLLDGPQASIRVTDHLGVPLIRDAVPFFDLFPLHDRVWPMNVQLQPSGYYNLYADVTPTQDREAHFPIGMFGYREEIR